MKKSLGVALGGGGAKGLAHIAILETIDELGFEVSTLSGTSVGAVVGVLYAAGLALARSAAPSLALVQALQRPRLCREIPRCRRPTLQSDRGRRSSRSPPGQPQRRASR